MPIFEKKSYSDRFNIYLLNQNVYYQRETEDEIKKRFLWFKWSKSKIKEHTENNEAIRYYANAKKDCRANIDDVIEKINNYDVVSFDIFDTVLYRNVDTPTDIFDLVGLRVGIPDFKAKRIKAESLAREYKFSKCGSREVTLDEIYSILNKKFSIHIDKRFEEEVEIENINCDPYAKKIYDFAISAQKKVIFTSDMYLSQELISSMLNKCGYKTYDHLFISNRYLKNKGIGDLFGVVKKCYPNKKIIHLGDNINGDVKNPPKYGIESLYIPSIKFKFKEINGDGIIGSIYRSIIQSKLNNGLNKFNLQYEHGYRVGGILCYGFCTYIEKIARENNIDRIVFCARDCEIIWRCYKSYFNNVESKYLQVSRYSLLNAMPDKQINDIIYRFIMPNVRNGARKQTIETILKQSGYEVLIPELDKYDIERYAFPCNIRENTLINFLFDNIELITAYNREQTKAAKKYFDEVVGNAKRLLFVDIGWSGTCISASKVFLKDVMQKDCEVFGALMCTSRSEDLKAFVQSKEIDGYIYTPFKNVDLARFMMPSKVSKEEQEFLHMPLEYLFTSADRSLIRYTFDSNGEVGFVRHQNSPTNVTEIKYMQKGILDFCNDFHKIYLKNKYEINPYVAFGPLKESIQNRNYTYHVYRRFRYDALTVPYKNETKATLFEDLFKKSDPQKGLKVIKNKKTIIFVSPEMTYTGTPRSLLRMVKVAIELGYEPIVWTNKRGPFEKEFESINVFVQEVSESDLDKSEIINQIKQAALTVCNTIVVNKYARVFSQYVPTVWYIREATNIPDFIKNNPERKKDLEESNNIYCVSEYAADAISKYTTKKVRVIRNAVEDESESVLNIKRNSDKIRFIQLGTIEYRKGYDVLVKAFLTLPKEYKNKVELVFAGGMINSGTPLASYIFSEIQNSENIRYLGVIDSIDEKNKQIAQSDVVIVASRDESCSLVALEGAMLSKPLIVTENVGAKYIVEEDNGIIVPAGNVESLKSAIIKLVDDKLKLKEMGKNSRRKYEELASMEFYKRQLCSLYSAKEVRRNGLTLFEKLKHKFKNNESGCAIEFVVSLTSYPARIKDVNLTIQSLINQSVRPKKIVLYLAKQQFDKQKEDLPIQLVNLQKTNNNFEIKFVDDDIRPHKKYFYSVREFKEMPVIIVDDDMVYDRDLCKHLIESYKKWPNCVSCTRANLMTFNQVGELRSYAAWPMNYRLLLDIPSYQLLPTGVGGVLYPPNSLPAETFDIERIKNECIDGDDLWLKFMTVKNGVQAVCIKEKITNREIPDSQDTALWKQNVNENKNDVTVRKILEGFSNHNVDCKSLLVKVFKDRFE